ncbi:MAG: hypothetical protein R3186_08015, partial [Ruegeria sp.]|nr:hypothetical protein [Ruegeria sp.]
VESGSKTRSIPGSPMRSANGNTYTAEPMNDHGAVIVCQNGTTFRQRFAVRPRSEGRRPNHLGCAVCSWKDRFTFDFTPDQFQQHVPALDEKSQVVWANDTYSKIVVPESDRLLVNWVGLPRQGHDDGLNLLANSALCCCTCGELRELQNCQADHLS